MTCQAARGLLVKHQCDLLTQAHHLQQDLHTYNVALCQLCLCLTASALSQSAAQPFPVLTG